MTTQITVNRSKLEQALSIVQAAAAGQSTVPLYTQVLFSFTRENGISLRATDANTYMQVPVPAAGEGACEIAVHPKRLGSILANLTREEVAFTVQASEGGALALAFACGRQKASLPGMDRADFIDLPTGQQVKPIHRFVLAANVLRDGLRRAGYASMKKCDTEADKRWNCLCVSADLGRLRLNTADGARFAQMVIPVESYEHFPGNVPSENDGKAGRGKAKGEPMFHRTADATMIPLVEVTKIARLLEAAADAPATVEIGWRMVAVTAGDYRAVLPVWDASEFAAGILKLVNARREAGFKSQAVVNREELARAVRAAKASLPTEGLFHETMDGAALMLWPGADAEGNELGAELHVSTGQRAGAYYADVLSVEADLPDHLECLKLPYLGEALAAADSPKVRLSFSPAERRGISPVAIPGPVFVEEAWEAEKGEGGAEAPGADRPEWLAVIQPLNQEDTPLARALIAEWERVSGRAWDWAGPQAIGGSEENDTGSEEEIGEEEIAEDKGEAAPGRELTGATA